MNKSEFLVLMNFPKEWEEWGMYPDRLFDVYYSGYVPGDEEGSEHDRNGAFHWWLKQDPCMKILSKLWELSYLDPDEAMGADVRSYIKKAKNYEENSSN